MESFPQPHGGGGAEHLCVSFGLPRLGGRSCEEVRSSRLHGSISLTSEKGTIRLAQMLDGRDL